MKNYTPRPGSVPELCLQALATHGAMSPIDLARAIKMDNSKNLQPSLKAALQHGLLFKDGDGRKTLYRLPGDQSADAAEPSAPTRAGRQTRSRAAPPAVERCDEQLQIAAWSDGDVLIEGDALRFTQDDEGAAKGVMLSRAQVEQIVRFVARPMVDVLGHLF